MVGPGSAPTLILQGTRDGLVRPGEAETLQAALVAAHVSVELVRYDGGHAFQGLDAAEIARLHATEIAFAAEQLRTIPAAR